MIKKWSNSQEWFDAQNQIIISFLDGLVEAGIMKMDIIPRTEYNDKQSIEMGNKIFSKSKLEADYKNMLTINNSPSRSYTMSVKAYLDDSGGDVFFAREFANENKNIYEIIKKIIEVEFNKNVVMLEETSMAGNINSIIYNEIKKCSFVIADISSFKECDKCIDDIRNINQKKKLNEDPKKIVCNQFNLNVLYEIGLAHAFKKQVIIIMDKRKKAIDEKTLPFDISSHNVLEYESEEQFKIAIRKMIKISVESQNE